MHRKTVPASELTQLGVGNHLTPDGYVHISEGDLHAMRSPWVRLVVLEECARDVATYSHWQVTEISA